MFYFKKSEVEICDVLSQNGLDLGTNHKNILVQSYKGTTCYSQQQFIETKLIFHHIGNIVYTAEVHARGTNVSS